MDVVENPTLDEKLVQRMIEDLMPYFASQIIFDNTQVKARAGRRSSRMETGFAVPETDGYFFL